MFVVDQSDTALAILGGMLVVLGVSLVFVSGYTLLTVLWPGWFRFKLRAVVTGCLYRNTFVTVGGVLFGLLVLVLPGVFLSYTFSPLKVADGFETVGVSVLVSNGYEVDEKVRDQVRMLSMEDEVVLPSLGEEGRSVVLARSIVLREHLTYEVDLKTVVSVE